jgi:hypothetical protein
MNNFLSLSEVKRLIEEAELTFRHQECAICECYLAYITQMELDADPQAQQYLQDYQQHQELVHACLGCDPCPPGIIYSDYLRKKSRKG